ncbi:MAG TPA: SdrD B-like domain-containing protein [Bacteroidota bacterium]|nr:SdrD B-like domain-containing protein [Bacteroidota bacterium]
MNIRLIGILLFTISLLASCIAGEQSVNSIAIPPTIRAGVTSGSTITLNPVFTVDGRDHDTSGTLLTGTGTFGVWCAQSLTLVGGARIGGTNTAGADIAPSRPPDTSIIRSNAATTGTMTPDALFGLPEGTLRILARSGSFPGQYVTASAELSYPLSGLTYIDLPANGTLSGSISGSGILIIHNYDSDASSLQNWSGTFKGLVFADRVSVSSTNGTILGAVITALPFSVSGSGSVSFSRAAIVNALSLIYPFTGTCMTADPQTIKLPDAELGIPYRFTFNTGGGTPPLSWTAVRVPSWLSLSSDGSISGTPPALSADTLLLTVADASGCSVGRCFILSVDSATAISGRVVWDANQNFTADAGESGLANWKLDLFGANSDSALTDFNGYYTFAGEPMGNYLLQLRNRPGWIEEAYSPKYFSSSDSMLLSYMIAVFRHLDTIGQNAGEYVQRPTVAGGGGGSLVGYAMPSVYASDIFATYSVSNVVMNSLSINADCKFPGAERISAFCDGSRIFSLVSGIDPRLRLIALRSSQPGCVEPAHTLYPFEIRGRIFAGYRDSRVGLAGRTVHLHGPIDTTAVTDQDGGYVFRNFPWGTYAVTEDSVPGWQLSSPSPLRSGLEYSSARTMAIQQHLLDIIADADRYYWSLSVMGGGSGSFSGYTIPAMLSTDSLAAYQFSGVPAGSISITAKPNWSSEFMNFTFDESGTGSMVYVTSPDFDLYPRPLPGSFIMWLHPLSGSLYLGHVNADFGNTQEKEIDGFVYDDANGNGVRDSGETGIEGWKIFLSGPVADSTETDAYGAYRFADLPSGTYTLTEGYHEGTWAFTPSYAPVIARRDSIIRNLRDICAQSARIGVDASRFWNLSVGLGGGGGAYYGYSVPGPLAGESAGICFPVSWNLKTLSLRDSSRLGYGNMYSVVDTAGLLLSITFTGELDGLTSRVVNTDSSAVVFSNINFGNAALIESITATAIGGGSVIPSGSITVIRGNNQGFTFTPNMGYRLDSVITDGINQGDIPSYTLTGVISNHIITAYYSLEQYPFSISLNERWNLISVPMIDNDSRRSTLFPGAISQAFSFQGSYHLSDSLVPGKGYWLKFAQAETLGATGGRIWIDTIAVLEGWNLIGSICSPVAEKDIGSEPADLAVSQLFGYNGKYLACDTIEPWKGYWLKANQSGLIILSGHGPEFAKPGERNRVHIVHTGDIPPSPPDGALIFRADIPKEFSLDQSYPNPFNPATRIQYALPIQSRVILKICNLLGEVVATLVDGTQEPGYRSVIWNAGSLASGIYFCRLEAVSVNDPQTRYSKIRKTILLK